MVRAPVLHAGGGWFDSNSPYHLRGYGETGITLDLHSRIRSSSLLNSTNMDTAKVFTEIFAVAVAQMVEHQFVALNVAGSNPVGHPNKMDP